MDRMHRMEGVFDELLGRWDLMALLHRLQRPAARLRQDLLNARQA